jgi:hypothetical protein
MIRSEFSTFCVMAALAGSALSASGQATNSSVQNVSARGATSRAAPAPKAFGVASAPLAAHLGTRPTGLSAQRFAPNSPCFVNQPVTPRSTYSPIVRPLHQTYATLRPRPFARADNPQAITLDAARRERVLRALAAIRQQHRFGTEPATLATVNPQRQVMTHDPPIQREAASRQPSQQNNKWRNKNDRSSYFDACRRHRHEWHDRAWWHEHCDRIVFVSTGYYFLDGSYWYPAWGYDPFYNYYDYDGPIYTYGDLLPDEVIANVQVALQDAGYYFGPVTGSLDAATRAALANFQRDYGLPITGAIDEPTVEALGLY